MPPVSTPARPRSLPHSFHWKHPDQPLPRLVVRQPSRTRPRTIGLEAPPWIPSGPPDEPFDFSAAISRLCGDIAQRCAELKHIDSSRMLVGITQARGPHRHGLQARVTPLRFHNGVLTRQRDGVRYRVQRYFVNGQEMLYLVTFCLPRFLEQDFDDKFITLFHELFHISPAFEGDLRRMNGRCALHSYSKRAYDRHMAALARAYLASVPDPSLYGFLRLDFAQLRHRHGSVIGAHVPRPRLLPMHEDAMPE